MLQGCTNDDIGQLDWKEPKLNNRSLRDLIMGINSRNPDTPGTLFRGVGQDWKGRFIFLYLSNKAGEAGMIADSIIPYLMHHHGAELAGFFIQKEWRLRQLGHGTTTKSVLSTHSPKNWT